MFKNYKIGKKISSMKNKDKILQIVDILQDKSDEELDSLITDLSSENNPSEMPEHYIMLKTVDLNDKDSIEYINTDPDNDTFASNAKEVIRESLINKLGEEYEMRLEEFDPDIATAFKEADYQIARADVAEAELQYYRAINDPNGPKSIQLQHMWERVIDLKKRLQAFEQQ